MKCLTVALFLGIVSPVVSFGFSQKTYYARALANFQCKGQPVSAPVEFMEANDKESEHTHIVTVNSKDGKFDVIAHAKSRRNFFQIVTFRTTLTDFFLRVHHDCGCGAYFDTPFIPHESNYRNAKEAKEKPYDYGTVEISKCRIADGKELVTAPPAEKAKAPGPHLGNITIVVADKI
uniref:Uncharacterized protein n=1 Tax=Panagrellus redivivus TaxID=6233 RepID=A0A7E4V758_PANRE